MLHTIFSFGIIDFVIILGFLSATIFVGIKHGLEITDLRGYAVGNNNFKTFALVATITATYMSGSGFFTKITRIYTDSTLYLFAACLLAFQALVMAWFIIPKMKIFIGKLSIAEKMGEIYDNKVRLIVALTGMFSSVGNIAVQFKVFGTIIAYCANVNPNLAIIVAGVTVTAYSSLGGIKSVTTTDKLQLATFLIAIPYILLIVIDETFYKGFSSTGAPPLFDIKPGTFSTANTKFWDTIILGLWFMLPNMHPVYSQRIMMAKNVKQAKVAFKYSGYLILLITILLGLIALMVYNFDPNIDNNSVISYIIDNFTTVGLKGFLIVGVLAMAMSTADSFINISSVLFANDVCIPLKLFKNKELIISRAFAAFLGLGSIYLALSDKDLLSIILSTNKYYTPVATPIILLTIFGFRTSNKIALSGMLTGFIIITLSPSAQFSALLIGMISNAAVILAFHYLFKQKGGWTKIEMDEEEIDMRSAEQIAADEEAARMEKLKWQIAGNNQQLFDELEKTLKNAPQNEIPTNRNETQAMQNIVARLKKQGLPKDIIAKITGLPQTEI